MHRIIYVTGVAVLSSTALLADFQYQQTTRITGGMVASMARFAGKKATEPPPTTVAVKGNRMVHVSSNTGEITDLDKETITHIDFDKKTYSVMTFEQMKQAMQDAMKRMQESKRSPEPAPAEGADKAELSFKASVQETGQSKPVNGVDAKEFILVMQMIGTDKQSGQSGAMNITNDMWMAPEVKGYEEIRDFERRMVIKMGSMLGPGAAGGVNPMAMMRPEMGKGLAEMAKEMSKLKGIPIMQITRMGATADGQPLPAASQAPELSSQGQMPSAGDMAGHAAGGAAAGAVENRLGRIGGIAGGLGGLGGLGRKKKQDQPQEQAAGSPQQQGAAAGGGLLFESTSEMSGFSSAPVDSVEIRSARQLQAGGAGDDPTPEVGHK